MPHSRRFSHRRPEARRRHSCLHRLGESEANDGADGDADRVDVTHRAALLEISALVRRDLRGRRLVRIAELADSVELLERDADTLDHRLLGLADPLTRIVVLLVRLVGALRVADLALQVIAALGLERAEAVPVRPLGVRVNVHLDHTVRHRLLDLVVGGARATVHDKEDRLVGGAAELGLGVSLVLAELLRGELDVARLVHAVHVTKGSGDREGLADRGERLVDGVDLLRGSVKLLRVDVLIVDAILFTASDADLHLEEELHRDHLFEVLDAELDVFLIRLLREVKHMARKERLASLLEEVLVGGKHAVKPREELLGAVVRVDDDRDAVKLGDRAHVVRDSDRASDRGGHLVDTEVVKTLAADELAAALRHLDDDRRLGLGRSLHDRVAGRGAAARCERGGARSAGEG
mmetsp:Transcript_63100/g.173183  ORF Transcript_63100/g.173183 Transcript_63100/m.173183 type:complete len:408 (-) Transcript_63100:327-1550(-)